MATSLLLGGCSLWCVLGVGRVGVALFVLTPLHSSQNTRNLPPGTGQRPFRLIVRERARLQGRLPRLELLQAARSPAPETEELQKETRPSPLE